MLLRKWNVEIVLQPEIKKFFYPVIIANGSRGIWFIEVFVGFRKKDSNQSLLVSYGKPSQPSVCSITVQLWVFPLLFWHASIAVKGEGDNHWMT